MRFSHHWLSQIILRLARPIRRRSAPPGQPHAILISQPSHIGDLLIDTPLFDALRRRFPAARIVCAVGTWNADVLRGNPHIDDVVVLNAPWNNAFVTRRDPLSAARFVLFSPAVRRLARQRFDVGIDPIATLFNTLLLHRIGAGHVLGAGSVEPPGTEHRIRTALRFAERLGATDLPPLRPQIFLQPPESRDAQRIWANLERGTRRKRVVLGPAGSQPYKCYPLPHFHRLAAALQARGDCEIVVVGGRDTLAAGAALATAGDNVHNLVGQVTLRQTFALTASADLVVSNPNLLWHVCGAFAVRAVVVLADAYASADREHALWGYDNVLVLGKDPQHPRIFEPDEIMPLLAPILAATPTRHTT